MGKYDNEVNNFYSRDYCCIICGGSFSVLPKDTYHGDPHANQTLFCAACLQTLKASLNRETTKDFGW